VTFIAIISIWQRRIKIKQTERENEEKFFSPDFDKETGPYESDKVNMSTLRLIKLNELELGRILGRGAFGTVYEGHYRPFDDDDQSNYKVKVAIKVLNKPKFSDEKAVSRLSEELINVSVIDNKFKGINSGGTSLKTSVGNFFSYRLKNIGRIFCMITT